MMITLRYTAINGFCQIRTLPIQDGSILACGPANLPFGTPWSSSPLSGNPCNRTALFWAISCNNGSTFLLSLSPASRAVQLPQTGAREALGQKFNVVSTVPKE